ncbi:L,D-transpeptidase [Amycolatopsis minnesotensis]|uniref:L,D-TPase catalytic domain-containing protein n=1 Tax=Amycolatopsis minnesotensis TaxID=337894 RepID=A0ABN2SE83_9PSEU
MGIKKIVVGIAALAATAVLAACSGGSIDSAPAAGGAQPGAASVPASAPASTPSSEAPVPPAKPAAKPIAEKPKPAPAAGIPCANVVTGACVDISSKQSWLVQDGKVVYGPVPMTSGRKGHATPTGTFHVLSKEKMHLSKQFDMAPMPNSVFFYPGDAFHTGSLKVPSHGCIHLSKAASQKFFSTLNIGDTVQVVS